MPRLAALTLAALVVGCFSESPHTGDPACPAGSNGCLCTASGGCDEGLQCHGPSGRCWDPECERGTQSCECLDGLCVGALQCLDQLCQPPSDGTGGSETSASTATTTMSSAESGTTTTDATTSSTSPDSSSTLDTTMTTMSETSTTEMPVTCESCIEEAEADSCSMAYAACHESVGEGSCTNAINCDFMAGVCCPPMDQGGPIALYEELIACLHGQCIDPCGDFGTDCPGG